MIQFNLLPDIKVQYLHARRQKQIVVLTSGILIAVSLTVLVLLISFVFVAQKKNLADLSRDITASSKKLNDTKDLSKMLTVQNQLRALPSLHEQKPIASRLFGYVSAFTPAAVSVSHLSVNFSEKAITLSGSADSLETVNTFTDTLKFATYTTKKAPNDEKLAFSDVVLSTFSRDSKGATYTITFKFDPVIFTETEDVTLTVPNRITTRSQIEQPAALFKQAGT